ncbi:MAG TPA: transposase, partial [Dermatophilaceae bacterium]|nr:transposase [Dermatophilaceae bacterium]
AAHLVSWAKLSPRANQSGAKTRSGKTGKGNPYLKSVLGEAAASAGRIGKLKALVAVARSILVIVWHLLADPTRRYRDLGPEFFDNRIRPERRKINHVRQLEALGYTVTLTPQPDYQPRRQFIFRSGNRELRCV